MEEDVVVDGSSPALDGVACRMLAQALRTKPRVYTWGQLKFRMREVSPASRMADDAWQRIKRVSPACMDLNRLCELARVPPEEVGTQEQTPRVFRVDESQPKVVQVSGQSDPHDPIKAIRVSPIELAIWDSIRRALNLARRHYRWPENCGIIFDVCRYVIASYTRVQPSSLLQRMRKKGLLAVSESGKVGQSQTLWSPRRPRNLRMSGGKPATPGLSDKELTLILRRVLWNHRSSLRTWRPWCRILIPEPPEE